MKGRIARRAMELGSSTIPSIDRSIYRATPKPKPVSVSEIRLIQTMRKIDPALAHMIESLAPVYLVKK